MGSVNSRMLAEQGSEFKFSLFPYRDGVAVLSGKPNTEGGETKELASLTCWLPAVSDSMRHLSREDKVESDRQQNTQRFFSGP